MASPSGGLLKVLYDGHCRFCCSQIGLLKRLDWFSQLTPISLHDPQAAQAAPDLSFDQMMDQMWVVLPDGSKGGGIHAVRLLARKMPTLYPLLPLLYFPGTLPLWDWAYRTVARYRYRLAGKNCSEGTCQLHGRR
ncbi:MAG: thiol-disulfide oxidoreductase DCC family protein [Pirellulaceae bacterium]|jgi:predicted DCC family thiol-disulfide oxidoreductase YuxK